MITALGNKRKADAQGPADADKDERRKRVARELEFLSKYRSIHNIVLDRLTDEEVDIIKKVKSSATDYELINKAFKIRIKHRLSVKLQEDMHDSDYYFENGLRRVYPYSYMYQACVKRRWIGKKIKDILTGEFRELPENELQSRFERGMILINGESVNGEYIIRDNDHLCNRVHRHELPVLATPIKIIHNDKDMLVIDKPPSLPIHPCGRFRHNSIVNVLEREHGIKDLKIVHRLDRLVSGVVLVAKNIGNASRMYEQIKNHQIEKEYVCRVEGEFPFGDSDDEGFITVDKPLETVRCKVSIMVILDSGKSSVTKFRRLNYNGKTSTVLCKPLTGRMHQIRVHLQYLGYPIVNDFLYNNDVFGPERGKGGRFGKPLDKLAQDIIAAHNIKSWLMYEEEGDGVGLKICDSHPVLEKNPTYNATSDLTKEFLDNGERSVTLLALKSYFDQETWQDISDRYKYDEKKDIKDPHCIDCNRKYFDPPLRRMFMYLHAFRYSGKGWSYQSEMPVWAKEDWPY